MVIALVMRAAELGGPNVPADILGLRGQGMQAAYTYVKNKSKWVGPNMSYVPTIVPLVAVNRSPDAVCRLIYQLLDYERALRGGSPTSSFGPSEDEEWERRRRLLDEEPDQESTEVLKEAKALDEEMEERRARKASQGSLASVGSHASSFTGAVGTGALWRSRFGHAGFALASQRTRAGSIGSTYTSRSSISVLSEDPVEEEEEEEEDTFGSGKNVTTPSTDATDEDAHRGQIIVVRGELERPAFKLPPIPATPARLAKLKMDAAAAGVPPSAPATRRSFNLPAIPPSAPANKRTFKIPLSDAAPPSAPFHRQSFEHGETASPLPASGLKKGKRRPPPLLGVPAAHSDVQIQVVLSPSTSQHSSVFSSASSVRSSTSLASSSALSVDSSTSTSSKALRSSRRKSFKPPAIFVPFPSTETPPAPASAVGATPLASQTLFVFPPSPKGNGGKTPSTLMLTTVQTPTHLTAGFGAQGGPTPRALSFTRKRTDGRRSWVSGAVPVTPTIATARVDAKGYFGLPNP